MIPLKKEMLSQKEITKKKSLKDQGRKMLFKAVSADHNTKKIQS